MAAFDCKLGQRALSQEVCSALYFPAFSFQRVAVFLANIHSIIKSAPAEILPGHFAEGDP
jgi:hypothetical protein